MKRFKNISSLKKIYVIRDLETGETLSSIPIIIDKLNELDTLSKEYLINLDQLEKAIEKVSKEYKHNQEVQEAILKIHMLKLEGGDINGRPINNYN